MRLFPGAFIKNDPGQLLNIRSGGLMFYGGLLGGVLGGAIYCRIRKKSFCQMADLACMGTSDRADNRKVGKLF